MAIPIIVQKMIEAVIDAESLGVVVNGNESTDVVTRLGAKYPTIKKAIRTMFETGGLPASPFETKALMIASSLPNGAYAVVTNDAALANNGYYQKQSGTWVFSGYNPVVQSKSYTDDQINGARQSLASLSAIGDYLTSETKKSLSALDESDARVLTAKAIKKIAITNPTVGKQYRINILYKNDATFGSRIVVNDDTGAVAQIIIPVSTVVSGLQEYSLSGSKSGKVLIDWDVLQTTFVGYNVFLYFDNNKYLKEYLNDGLVGANTTAINNLKPALLPALLPDWIIEAQAEAIYNASAATKKVMNAVKGIDIIGASQSDVLKLATVTKQDATFGSRLLITNSSGTIVLQYISPTPNRTGLETCQLQTVSNSGLSGTLTINWDEVSQGLALNGSTILLIKYNAVNLAKGVTQSTINTSDIAILQTSLSSSSAKIPTKPYKLSIVGSSITWGGGYLGEKSYVGTVEQILRNQYATTLHAAAIAPSATTLIGNDFYQGSAKRISGINTELLFSLTGDELSLSVARERENMGASIIELYVDNVLYDTFDTYNDKPSVSRTENFTGNGTDLKFNLDGAFTYAHNVKVGGVAKTGSISSQSSGATIPSGDDYMIVRRYDTDNNRVVHSVWFKAAPTGAIVVTYKQGENIRHLRGTIDRIGAGLTTALENPYADGNVSYDTTNPVAVSSGLGFRESDKRSIKTWRFDDSKTRQFKLKIKQLHASATGATPYLDLNFATNRMHHIQNAGIGGWTAQYLLDSAVKINRIDEVINFNPDIVLLESATNDDWASGIFKAHVVRTGVTSAEILASPSANYYTAITGTVNNKTVSDVRLPITAIDSNSVTLGASVIDTTVTVGDTITIGNYGSNHKRVATRVIKAYDSATRKVTFNRSISTTDFYQVSTLSNLLTESVMIYNSPTWAANVKQLVDTVQDALPVCKVSIATAGIPHFYMRKLFGYRELAQQLAKDKSVEFVDYYDATFNYQYTQPLVTHQTITSTGAIEYALTGTTNTLANPTVFVNGVEHKRFRVIGGLSRHWASGVTDATLSNTSNTLKSYKLIFDSNVPASGATIVVKKSTSSWSHDYTHPNATNGNFVLGQAASGILKNIN